MFYFGRIISAFFNQLFRFLFNNRLGQKILIIIIISLIAFWCLNMTEVHAVDEVTDINYEVKSYYDGVCNEAILRLEAMKSNTDVAALIEDIKTNQNNVYFYYGQVDGSSYLNANPISSQNLNIILFKYGNIDSTDIQTTDYLGVTSYTMYKINYRYWNPVKILSYNSYTTSNRNNWYMPIDLITYTPENWTTYVTSLRNGDNAAIIQLLEDIKAEQQATNDFLTDSTMDDSNIDIPSPTLDSTTQSTDTSIHNSINSLTSSLQDTITNYYERLGCLRLGYTYA